MANFYCKVPISSKEVEEDDSIYTFYACGRELEEYAVVGILLYTHQKNLHVKENVY